MTDLDKDYAAAVVMLENEKLCLDKTRKDLKTLQRKMTDEVDVVKRLEEDLQKNSREMSLVSDHAIVRFLELTGNISIKQIRINIINGRRAFIMDSDGGDGRYDISGGLQAIVRGNVVATVI